ncbi:hypothetical protein [Porphyromonas sp. COT-239 OH1446]|uniref:THUMP-like domain-containing protein n=1 Tax=Porphyromonas sp. COT-239 OH1446 TaxID=1515613 RepID=UPI00052DCE63|nr:hypothetical protein [Porphyromonas sp. COT-239 OH1446]KGN67189.1 hypothetical protein HQ37_08170 [Porphyromonas sp. COT-239 OH1446]
MTSEEIAQIIAYRDQYQHLSPERILLGSTQIPPSLRSAVALQIKERKALERKLPHWASQGVYLPSSLSLEQCSSQLAATYKQRFVDGQDLVLELSGGLGVDFSAFVERAAGGIYVEEQEALIEAASYNLPRLLPRGSFSIVHGNSMELLEALVREHRPSLIYVDPARRAGVDRQHRVYAIEDCSPSLSELLERLPPLYDGMGSPRPRLLVKLSPMLDLIHTLQQAPHTRELHIVSVKQEVKELLLLMDLSIPPLSPESVPVYVVEIDSKGQRQELCWHRGWSEEATAPQRIASVVGEYVYEPSPAMMKSGFFKSIAARYDLEALHPDAHLYTSDEYKAEFIGRRFRCQEVIPLRASQLRTIGKRLGRAQISCRNLSLSPDELRSRLGIKDGGERTLLGTRLSDGSQVLLNCYLCSHDE